MKDMEGSEKFVIELTASQIPMQAYIHSLVGDRSKCSDILQETNLSLWRKKEEYQADRPFLPWAFTFARFQVMAYLRDRKRERMVITPDLAEKLSAAVEQQVLELDSTQAALQQCLQNLDSEKRDLIRRRYFKSQSISNLAEALGRSVSDIKVSLLRIRRKLADCIQKRLALRGESQS
ncbi:MAG: sigma-70 family RNA polymerase sigma factor [Planctomycetota bacterium]